MGSTHNTILQDTLFVKPWQDRSTLRLPGVNPLAWPDWLLQDETFAKQMAYRDALIINERAAVFMADQIATNASQELLDIILRQLKKSQNYYFQGTQITRPDGTNIDVHSDHPLIIAGRLVQHDLCILQKSDGEHVLTGGILCFPSNWRLNEKIGHSLSTIHNPVASYDATMGKRVQRIFDGIKPDNPVWRANYLLYATSNLFQPNREKRATRETGKFIRVERQSLIKLPKSDAVVFGIHTNLVSMSTVSDTERESFLKAWESTQHYVD